MQKKHYIMAAAIVLLSATLVMAMPEQAKHQPESERSISPTAQIAEDSTLEAFKWYTIEEALALQETTNKKIFMDVYTTWCGPCKMLDANTFSHPVIKKILSEYYLPVKFNAESQEPVTYKEKVYTNPNYSPQPRKSTHQFAIEIAATDQGLAYPTMVFMDEQGNRIQPITGYLEPARLEPILMFFGSGAYKVTTWPDYFNAFKSAITQ